MKKVCIIGAGITGLAAAHRLAREQDSEITIIEQESVPGGLARTVATKHCRSDLGPHRFNTEIDHVDSFINEFAAPFLIAVPRRSRMLLGGNYLSYPPQPFDLFKNFGPLRTFGFIDSFLFRKLAGIFQRNEIHSFEDIMERAFGPELYRTIVYPYTKKVWGMEPSELSMDVAKVRVSAGGVGKLIQKTILGTGKTHLNEFLYFKGGTQTLIDQFVNGIESNRGTLITGTKVVALTQEENTVRIVYKKKGKTQELAADYCISTIPLTDLCLMLLKIHRNTLVKGLLPEFKYIRLACVLIEVNKPHITDNSWLYFPEERVWINRAYEAKNFDPSMCPEDKSIICAEVSLNDEARWKLSNEIIASNVIAQLAGTELFAESDVTDSRVVRLPHAYPIYDMEYKKRLSSVWQYLVQFPRIVTTGRQGLFHHNNMDHSIIMGQKAAECVIGHDEPAHVWYDSLDQFADLRIID